MVTASREGERETMEKARSEPAPSKASNSIVGRKILVTGAGTGIGRAVALGLARAGANVALHFHEAEAGARSAQDELRAEGLDAALVSGDLASPEQTRSMVAAAADALGGLDVLVNNAGLTMTAAFESTPAQMFERLFRTNVEGTYVAIQAALPYLEAATDPSVVTTTSGHGAAGFPGFSAYAATKGAIVALTRQLAVELGPKGIRVNCVGPGMIEVEATRAYPGYSRAQSATKVPIGRMGLPEDLVGTVIYLASRASAFVTGQVIFVDGGISSRMGLHWPEVEADAMGLDKPSGLDDPSR
jgi:NAD(P)-dependent dehydrogenase (short-subunit alcohol dehydrogenase family)